MSREVRITLCVIGGVVILVVFLLVVCGGLLSAYGHDERQRCYDAGVRDHVPVRFDSDGCTTRGVFGIRVPVDY